MSKHLKGYVACAFIIFFLLLFVPHLPSKSDSCTIIGRTLSQGCTARLNRVRIAIVKPVFTATPYLYYDASSFYAFYHRTRSNVGYCTDQNIQWLNTTVVNQWGRYDHGLEQFVQSSVGSGSFNPDSTKVLTDVQVNDGALFTTSGNRAFDVVILGFEEYVTAMEYSNFSHFVALGGKLIMLTSNNFIAEVAYSSKTNTERLVLGHGWSFNGTVACRGIFQRWRSDNINWVGSALCCYYVTGYKIHGAIVNTSNPESTNMRNAFGREILQSYSAHEESALMNSTASSVIAYWNVTNAKIANQSHERIAIYSHLYHGGVVINTGVFGSDIIGSDKELQFLVYSSILTNFVPATSPANQWHTYLKAIEGIALVMIGIGALILIVYTRRRRIAR